MPDKTRSSRKQSSTPITVTKGELFPHHAFILLYDKNVGVDKGYFQRFGAQYVPYKEVLSRTCIYFMTLITGGKRSEGNNYDRKGK